MHKMQIQPTMCIVFYLISVFDLFSFKHLKYTQFLICGFISVLFSSSGKDSLKNNVFVLSVFHSDISEARVSQSCHVGLRAPVLSWYHSLCCKSSHTEQPQRGHHQASWVGSRKKKMTFVQRCITERQQLLMKIQTRSKSPNHLRKVIYLVSLPGVSLWLPSWGQARSSSSYNERLYPQSCLPEALLRHHSDVGSLSHWPKILSVAHLPSVREEREKYSTIPKVSNVAPSMKPLTVCIVYFRKAREAYYCVLCLVLIRHSFCDFNTCMLNRNINRI